MGPDFERDFTPVVNTVLANETAPYLKRQSVRVAMEVALQDLLSTSQVRGLLDKNPYVALEDLRCKLTPGSKTPYFYAMQRKIMAAGVHRKFVGVDLERLYIAAHCMIQQKEVV
ncbi:hypothetical protein HYW43_00975 [Candidatus Daviesbacteria bacterium]|nr:hypothetical protein [Candidatus Daviesbacteria bacterium]